MGLLVIHLIPTIRRPYPRRPEPRLPVSRMSQPQIHIPETCRSSMRMTDRVSSTVHFNSRENTPVSTSQGVFASQALLIMSTLVRCTATLVMYRLLSTSLGEAQLALWITVSTVAMYVSLCEAGLGQTVINRIGQAYARGQLELVSEIQATAHGLYWLIVTVTAVTAIVALRVFPVAKFLLSSHEFQYAQELIESLSWAIVLGLARLPFLVFPAMLMGTRQMPLRLICEIVATLLAMAVGMIASISGCDLLGVIIATNLAHLVATTAIYIFSARLGSWAKLRISMFRASHLRSLMNSSVYFFFINVTFLLDRSVLNLLAGKLVSLAVVPPLFLLLTFYRVAAWTCVSAISKAIQPYIILWDTQDRNDSVGFAVGFCTKTTALCAIVLAAIFTPFAEPLVNWWSGGTIFPGTGTVLLMTGAFLIDALFIASINVMMALKSQRSLARVLVVKCVFTIAAGWCGSQVTVDPVLGMNAGVLVATLVASIFLLAVVRTSLELAVLQSVDAAIKESAVIAGIAFGAIVGAAVLPEFRLRLLATSVTLVTIIATTWYFVLSDNERRVCIRGYAQLTGR
jgi:O-antigen/teichoic acid export membrane protein